MRTLFEQALHIQSPWYVKELQFNEQEKRLDIVIDFQRGGLFTYVDDSNGREFAGLKAYDTKEKSWRHLNFFEHECYLHAKVPRVKLPDGKVRFIKTPWEGLSNGFSLLFEALLLQLCQSMPVHRVASIVGTHDDKLWQMLERYIDATRAREDFSKISDIGIDETSRAKGHEYVTLFVDIKERRTLFVTEGKDASTIERFVEDFQAHSGDSQTITNVSCDMSPAFIKGVSETLPNAQITFDKFHILKIINEAVDNVRRAESKEFVLLKNTRYIWLKNEKNLTEKQKEKLQELSLSKLNLKTLKAYQIRQRFQEIYQAKTFEEFETYLKSWYYWATHSRIPQIVDVAKTIKRHWEGVLNYFKSRINNGILEGLNSLIQAAKAKARGYRTFKNFKIIVYLLTAKLDFSWVQEKVRAL